MAHTQLPKQGRERKRTQEPYQSGEAVLPPETFR